MAPVFSVFGVFTEYLWCERREGVTALSLCHFFGGGVPEELFTVDAGAGDREGETCGDRG